MITDSIVVCIDAIHYRYLSPNVLFVLSFGCVHPISSTESCASVPIDAREPWSSRHPECDGNRRVPTGASVN